MPTDTPRSYPLDPRMVKCDALWKTSPSGDREPHPIHCVCKGYEKIPLHPEPRVEVVQREEGWYAEIRPDPLGEGSSRVIPLLFFRGDTVDEALQAARLAWLGIDCLKHRLGCARFCETCDNGVEGVPCTCFDDNPCTCAAIEAAFAAKESNDVE